MTLNQSTTSIFIFESDPITTLSQKCFLENHNHSVQLVDMESSFDNSNIETEDIILLDIGLDNLINFPVLDQLLKIETRPKLLITTFENQVFKKDDFLKGGPAQILFKPFSPSDLLRAVETLTLTAHA